MMRLLLKLLHLLYWLYALLLFVVLMLLLFPFVLLATLFGRIRGGNIIYRICVLWGDVWFPLVGIWHRNIYEQPIQKDKAYIFVANHTSYLDAAIIVKTFRHHIRPLGKVELSKVPVFGFIYRNAIVTVDRSNPANRTKSVQLLKSVLRKGISILVFPEGTFNETGRPLKEFYDGAFRIALETRTPIKPVLFIDAYDRLHYSSIFSLTPGRNRSVILCEIPVDEYGLKDVNLLKEKVYRLMEEKLREYGASWLNDAARA